ncbi:MAG TPA: hypothetical protein VI336_00760, partial [Candidatus Saccharimonadales bacterium]|nr:hypothetical protein [Candidatus Saccharimonadales bacterium]
EISIDGARGILFNVIGGLDMSMHEINTVAETITAAADAEANIIFGATINPDLEGEIIVTVVATGFDEAYFTSPERTGARVQRRIVEPEAAAVGQVDEESMKNLDLELKEGMAAHAEDFHSEEAPNIWALSDDGNTTDKDKAEEEEKYETPSFFRRFRRKKGQPKGESDTDDEDEEPVEIEPEPEDKSDSSDKDKETKS